MLQVNRAAGNVGTKKRAGDSHKVESQPFHSVSSQGRLKLTKSYTWHIISYPCTIYNRQPVPQISCFGNCNSLMSWRYLILTLSSQGGRSCYRGEPEEQGRTGTNQHDCDSEDDDGDDDDDDNSDDIPHPSRFRGQWQPWWAGEATFSGERPTWRRTGKLPASNRSKIEIEDTQEMKSNSIQSFQINNSDACLVIWDHKIWSWTKSEIRVRLEICGSGYSKRLW